MTEEKLSPREEAYRVLMMIRRQPELFQSEFAKLKQLSFRGRQDLNLAIYLVSGTVKLQKRLDLILSKFLRKKLTSHSDALLTLMRLGCFQLLPECNIPHYAAVNEMVNLARKQTPGAEPVVNAVLKNISTQIETLTFEELRSNPLTYLTQYHSYPIWFVTELLSYWPVEVVEKFLKYGNEPQPLVVRLKPEQEMIKKFLSKLQQKNMRFKQGKFLKNFIHIISDANPTELPGFSTGDFVIQNEASGLVVDLLSPQPGESVLDLCAAPGGKTTDIAYRLAGAGKITAVDNSDSRLEMLKENLRRLGLDTVRIVQADGVSYESGSYDKILIDAPCSGSGVFRKFPEARWITTQEDVKRLSKLQYNLLDNVAKLLAPNGTIVYSTCSVLKGENEEVVQRFLTSHPDFQVVIPEGFHYLDVVGPDQAIRTYPGLRFLDNMYAVCLRKT